MSKRDDLITSFKNTMLYTSSLTYEEFLNEQMCIDAVIRNFEIIGEAANYISPEFKSDHAQIEWRKLTDFRNRLIHHYFGISYDIVWEVIKSEITGYLDYLGSI